MFELTTLNNAFQRVIRVLIIADIMMAGVSTGARAQQVEPKARPDGQVLKPSDTGLEAGRPETTSQPMLIPHGRSESLQAPPTTLVTPAAATAPDKVLSFAPEHSGKRENYIRTATQSEPAAITSTASVQQKSGRELEKSSNPHIKEYAYILADAIWRGSTNIYVCWENRDVRFAREMLLVQSAVADTWQKESRLEFTGWQQCAPKNAGIRILIDDSCADCGPHTKGLGRKLNGVRNGMVLNFTFENWSPSCRSMRDSCIVAIAVHEFGHAIGFSHEQNRPDTPGECQKRQAYGDIPGDILLTPYDPHSVMNYCNPEWNNNGRLSTLDIAAVQELYGKR